MTLQDIKKLNRFEFAERYPFVRTRIWNSDTMSYDLGTYSRDIEDFIKKGEPMLEFFTDDWHGWNSLLLCWAEKVKAVFDTMPKEVQDQIYIIELKEKYGSLRISLTGLINPPYDKINEYNTMLEHLSIFTCIHCGKIGKAGKKNLVSYKSNDYWITYACRKCAKEITYKDAKEYKIKPEFELKCKCKGKNPLNVIFKEEDWHRYSGDWFTRIQSYDGEWKTTRLNCHELIEEMM